MLPEDITFSGRVATVYHQLCPTSLPQSQQHPLLPDGFGAEYVPARYFVVCPPPLCGSGDRGGLQGAGGVFREPALGAGECPWPCLGMAAGVASTQF